MTPSTRGKENDSEFETLSGSAPQGTSPPADILSANMEPLPPAPPRLPGYEVLTKVGQGAMGRVYKARQVALDRPVAIKILIPGRPLDRFRREAKLLASIQSPHVVAVHDFDVLADGSPMLVMEWIEGQDLGRILKTQGGPLAEDKVLPWMRQTAEGMKLTATQGIIHRDLKPSNILIDAQGAAHVADFGLARGSETVDDLTGSSHYLMGTPTYMAPEQADDPRRVDTRADVYSFGACFYHVLTGRAPFEGESVFSILYRHKTEPLIPPRSRNPALSQRTNDLLERCLAKEPRDRFDSFDVLLRHLQPSPSTISPWDALEDVRLARALERYRVRRAQYLESGRGEEQELDRFLLADGRSFRIMRGNIVRQEVDAIVSSDNAYLTMNTGVSAAIRLAGGPTISAEARHMAPVRPGRVVVTSAGKLPARFVFHAVTIGQTASLVPATGGKPILTWVEPSRDLIAELLASCFYHAESLSVRTLALPLLGTGAADLSREVCLDTMVRYLARQLLGGLTPVQEVRLMLFP
jgi:serine/threonine protein kinase/O-acetyl-ADP-ribose deacetylase (regulator of RNase III)